MEITRKPTITLKITQECLSFLLCHGEVEFVARSRIAGRGVRLHERSHFLRVDGRWYYVDGDFPG